MELNTPSNDIKSPTMAKPRGVLGWVARVMGIVVIAYMGLGLILVTIVSGGLWPSEPPKKGVKWKFLDYAKEVCGVLAAALAPIVAGLWAYACFFKA